MRHNDKSAQIKKYANVPLPKNIKKAKESRINENKSNKKNIRKAISRNENEDFFIEYNKEIQTNNKLPPKTSRTYVRGNSAELRREKKSAIQPKRSKKLIQLKGKVKPQITQKEDFKQEIYKAKNEIKEELSKTNKTLYGLTDVLIYGFQGLFSLIQNDKAGFEENKKEFQKSVEISRQSKEIFKIEENTLKEENKSVDYCKIRENNITSDNVTEKNSKRSNRNNYGIFKESLENIYQKKNKILKN